MKKRNNKIAKMALGALLAVSLVAGTFAWFTASKSVSNNFSIKTPDVEIEEDFTPDSELKPGVDIKKQAWVCNTGKTDLVVRVKLTSKWKQDNAQDVSIPGSEEWIEKGFAPDVNKNWCFIRNGSTEVETIAIDGSQSLDGYFYFKGMLKPNEYTPLLLDHVKMKEKFSQNLINSKVTNYILTVDVETTQADPKDAATEEFGPQVTQNNYDMIFDTKVTGLKTAPGKPTIKK